MKLKRMHWIGIITALLIFLVGGVFFYDNERILYFIGGLGLGAVALPFIITFAMDNRQEQKQNEMFLEFTRDLAEAVSAGTPVSKGIINMKKKNFGIFNPHVQKLANQIEIGISVGSALRTFANDVDNEVVRRATNLINEAERSGGEIDYILESTAKSISEIEKLKKERKSTIYNLIVQGYIIFFIFIGIILVMEFKIIPLTTEIGDFGSFGSGQIPTNSADEPSAPSSPDDFTKPMMYLLITQGFFMGLVIGKLSEGSLKSGIKHSLILMTTAFLISGGTRLFIGG